MTNSNIQETVQDLVERRKQFEKLFIQLKKNREAVPLQQLTRGKYANSYRKLVADVEAAADWWASPGPGLSGWDYDKVAEIHKRESRPGGLVDKYKRALIDALDIYAFQTFAMEYFDTLQREAGPGHKDNVPEPEKKETV